MLTEPLKIERLRIYLKDLPTNLVGLTLVQLSDLHDDGVCLSEKLLDECIEESNRVYPDLVLLTGDYITQESDSLENLLIKLQRLKSKSGILAVLGNHDSYKASLKEKVIKGLSSINIKVLWNEIATPLGPELPIVGLADFWSREFKPETVFGQLDANIPRIVLSHNPDTAEFLQHYRVDLQLSGHTHGGQIILPGLGSVPQLLEQVQHYVPEFVRNLRPSLRRLLMTVKHWEWGQGWHQIGRNQLYVNRGLGSYFPGRLFCPPEMTVITLDKD